MTLEYEALSLLYDDFYFPVKKDIEKPLISDEAKNNKKVLLVFEIMPDEEEKKLLDKILDASKIKDSEVDIINKQDFTIDELAKKINNFSGGVISWSDEMPDEEKYIIIKKGNNSHLSSDSLNKINSNQQLKAKLWNCLKSMFLE